MPLLFLDELVGLELFIVPSTSFSVALYLRICYIQAQSLCIDMVDGAMYLPLCVGSFSVAVIRYSDKGNLVKKGLVLA